MPMVWDIETTVIRLIAVVLVFGLLHGRGGRAGRWVVLNLLTVTACAVAHFMRGGADDLASALGGAAVAAALAAPLAVNRRIAGNETAAMIAVGSVLGPLGSVAALGITAALHVLGRIAGADGGLFPDRFAIGIPAGDPSIGGSILAAIERSRLSRASTSARRASCGPTVTPPPQAIPLRVPLAVATLAVLMTEAFI